ncbi:MAG: hypothetical protein IKD42_03710 [Kiritimatiellae bacterium]|nr:hypothetical protein [Kiritimatiellia bacterium]
MIWEDEEEYPAWRRRWYVLHVKPRAEKKVALHLKAYGFFCHLPTFERVRKVQRRKVRTEIPVFPGYVFTRLLPDERIAILRSNLVVKTIFVKYPRTMIHQLRQIAKAFTRTDDFKVSSLYKSGDLVRVKYGPLTGVEGYVRRIGAKASLCLNVEMLGASVELSVSPQDVEKV